MSREDRNQVCALLDTMRRVMKEGWRKPFYHNISKPEKKPTQSGHGQPRFFRLSHIVSLPCKGHLILLLLVDGILGNLSLAI